MAFPRDLIPHKLPRTACRLTSYNVLYKNKARAQVLLLMDNISAVTYINKMGRSISPMLSYLARILVSAQYIPGVQNVEADRESRNRPLCLPTLLPTRSVCELATRPTGSSNRCVHPRQGDFSRVCLPSIRPDRPMPPTNAESRMLKRIFLLKIGRKKGCFSLGRKNNILIKRLYIDINLLSQLL